MVYVEEVVKGKHGSERRRVTGNLSLLETPSHHICVVSITRKEYPRLSLGWQQRPRSTSKRKTDKVTQGRDSEETVEDQRSRPRWKDWSVEEEHLRHTGRSKQLGVCTTQELEIPAGAHLEEPYST